MIKITKKYTYLYGTILVSFTIYILLDTFLISKVYTTVEDNKIASYSLVTENKTVNDTTYQDEHINRTLTTYRQKETNIYVADIQTDDSSYLKTAFANSIYGKNITEKTSTIAQTKQAILAINGDYYGVQEAGYVLKNGVVYRSKSINNREDLAIYQDGTFDIIKENEISTEELLEKGVYNILSFGPTLIKNKQISVSQTTEVAKSMNSNPRTTIGIISKNHYVFVTSDGRTTESKGLSLYELANFMDSLGCTIAYNLDGGGSSTMYFNGKIINHPTTNGNKITERSVSDIVYIGY